MQGALTIFFFSFFFFSFSFFWSTIFISHLKAKGESIYSSLSQQWWARRGKAGQGSKARQGKARQGNRAVVFIPTTRNLGAEGINIKLQI